MIIRWFNAGILAATLYSGAAAAEFLDVDSRNGGNWRSPPPAWGNTPGAAPYGNFRGQQAYGDGAPGYRRDRQRWNNNPNDRHERSRQDDWRGPTGRNDYRDGDRPRGLVQRRRPPAQDYPPPGYGPYAPPAYGPYAPYPGQGGYRPPPQGAYDGYRNGGGYYRDDNGWGNDDDHYRRDDRY